MRLRAYSLSCKKHTNNIGSKRVTMKNKVIRDKSRCGECLSDKLQFMAQEDSKSSQKKKGKQKLNKKAIIEYYKTNMLTYCLVCKKNTENKDTKMVKTKNGGLMLSSNCAVCGNKNSRFMKEREAKGL